MSNYNKATNFAVKDTLTSGDPEKVVSGAEIDNEFNSIASAVTSKADKVDAATTDNIATLDANGNLQDGGESVVSVAPPVGSVIMHASSIAPSGWLECDGSTVNRSTYPDLFNAIGSTFGAGDGSTTFNLPDLRGEFIRGWDDGRGVDSGRAFGSGQDDAIESHEHLSPNAEDLAGASPTAESSALYRGTVSDFGGPSSVEFRDFSTSGNGGTLQNSDSVFATTSTGGSETRPRNIALMYIIKT